MNISAINSTTFNGLFKRNTKHKEEGVEPEEQDTKKASKKQKNTKGKTFAKGVATGAIGAPIIIIGTSLAVDSFVPSKPIVLPNNSGITNVNEIAEVLDVPVESILISEDEKNITVPVEFNYLDEIIEEKREKISKYSDKPEIVERKYKELSDIIKQSKLQNQTAIGYINDGKVYYEIISEDALSVDDFEELFDIKEGSLAESNQNIIYDITEGGYCKDSDDGKLHKGMTIIVNRKDINN